MNKLDSKSEMNLDGAELLFKSSLHPPVIHCAYYAVHQKMTSQLLILNNISLEQLNNASIKSDKSSHIYLLEEFILSLQRQNVERNDWQDFQRTFKDLKTLRVKSDYHDEMIDSDLSSRAIQKSKYLLVILKSKR